MFKIPENILLKDVINLIETLESQKFNDIDDKQYKNIISILKKCIPKVSFEGIYPCEQVINFNTLLLCIKIYILLLVSKIPTFI